jgi:hypothetical protein
MEFFELTFESPRVLGIFLAFFLCCIILTLLNILIQYSLSAQGLGTIQYIISVVCLSPTPLTKIP